MRISLSALNFFLRLVEKPHLMKISDPLLMRARFERQARWLFAMPPLATILPDKLQLGGESVPALWTYARNARRDRVILYFHGGGYFFGSPHTHAAMLTRLSALSGMSCVLPDYRKAPEHVFPAAVEDALTAYKALLARGYAPDKIALGGDSAGGGLCFALLHVICTKDLPRPAAVFGFSPWVDLTLSGESLVTNAKTDSILAAERTEETVKSYLEKADARDPRASPLFGDFTAAPPVLIQVGSHEILLDDSRRLGERLTAQGVRAKVDIWRRVPHVWQIFQGRLRQADMALGQIARFLSETVG